MASRTELRVEFGRRRQTIATFLRWYFTRVLLMSGAVHVINPDKPVTPFKPKSGRIRSGSAPGPVCRITSLDLRLQSAGSIVLGAICVFVLSVLPGCNKKNQA